jgi:hypothetical protein
VKALGAVVRAFDDADAGLFDMATPDPPQVCRNLVDHERKFAGLSPAARVQCRVPRS